jgi:hypothetical protein
MARHTSARVFVAGSSSGGRPRLARVDIDGAEARVLTRDYVDPMIRSGRGGSSGSIAALGSMIDAAGATWLLAALERGRPRLIDPERLGVIALLGRRREWRGAADVRSPFLPVICDRAPLTVAGGQFLLTRARGGGLDLVRARAGEPIERWWLGEHSSRVELVAGDGVLALHAGDRVALIDVAELVPGGCPLTDPRDVELPLRWRSLPRSVVAVCDLLDGGAVLRDGAVLRIIEREGDRWTIAELELASEHELRRASWSIDRPERWLARAGSLWIAGAGVWTRIAAGRGPCEHSSALGLAMSPATIELDGEGHPWLWLWRDDLDELQRVDALALADGPIERWSIAVELRARQLLTVAPSLAADPRTILHADELAELLAFEPELREAWVGWFDRGD